MAGRFCLPAPVAPAGLGGFGLSVALLLAGAAPMDAQTPPEITFFQVAEQHRAVELYLSGDTEAAVRLLDERPLERQRELVDQVLLLAFVRTTNAFGETAPWTSQAIAALGALHMEAALHAYAQHDEALKTQARGHVRLGEVLLNFAAAQQSKPSLDRRWKLALGLTAMADDEAGWAEWFLQPACIQFPYDAPLLTACGTLRETYAAQMASRPSPRISDEALRRLRALRAEQLKLAEDLFSRALRADPTNLDARIRLAHVRMMQGRDRAAAPLLEDIESGKVSADPDTAYLALLFLGEIRQRARQPDRAVALFERASSLVPFATAAWIALAHAAHSRGDAPAAAGLLERVATMPALGADPWWGYWLGQYWLARPLLATLRAEARQ